MAKRALTPSPLAELEEAELERLALVAGRLLAGRPRLMPGDRPHRLKAGPGMEFLDHREYLPGDDLRNVDWLASARSGRTQVRRFRDETSSDWIICLDCSASMGIASGSKWRLAVQLAAAYAYLLISLDNRVGTILFRGRVVGLRALGRGKPAYAGILRLLESAAPPDSGGGSRLGACIAHLPPGCQLLVISDFLTRDHMAPDLARLSRLAEAVHAVQVLSRRETRIHRQGRTRLEDIESGATVSLELTRETLSAAGDRLRESSEALFRHCRKHGIGFTRCDAEEGWRSALMQQLKALGGNSA